MGDRPTTLPGRIPGKGDRPTTLPGRIPGKGDRPGNRPGIGDRPGDRPSNRPGRPGYRPGGDNINIGDINIGNTVINNRPSWVNIDRNQVNNIYNRWGNQIGGLHNWSNRYPGRVNHWQSWGNDVRHRYHGYGDCFGPSWWNRHPHGLGGWHYGYRFSSYPSSYWWTVPTFAACTSFFSWSAPATVWAQPIYYDYGQGGNVVYENNVVYINGQQVASADEFAESAAALATVPPPPSQTEAEETEWMPLGTFAVAKDPDDVDPINVIQLAVSQQGIISGTMYNTTTDQAYTVQGQVDRETQRVAFRIGESESIVLESGLYNLTQDEAPLLVHYGTDQVENWLLVRLEDDDDEEASLPDPFQ
ncbi:hypothetical protein NHH03_13805 [Stieleria sp. TO1_6]|uniref:hypothetical protein n=1 Tax=Stieleria tagensis TaxID=2956795 RepID=UPI00209A6C84|nr:hypothetical protein [Stieleria tagensis]MCO8122818.1 hypothetical protein [Stieleria tagensis]